jgi:hypothetical protein
MEKGDNVTHKITGIKLKVIKVMEYIAVCESKDYYHVIFHLYDNVHICKTENLIINENNKYKN